MPSRLPFRFLFLLGCLATAGLLVAEQRPAQRPPLNVRDFGAAGDGVALDHPAIQSAIDAAHAAGGGTVHLPAGIYHSGTVALRSNVTLDLAAGAVLRGTADLAHYRRGHWPALLMAKDQSNIAITGAGTLDGNSGELREVFAAIKASGDGLGFFPGVAPGETLDLIGPTGVPTIIDPHQLKAEGSLMEFLYGPFPRPFEFVRPQVIEFWGCRNITVRGITVANSACWVQTYRDCEDLLIEGITVRSNDYWNNDGIDLVDCRRVIVRDCDIDSADDALCLKSDPRGAGCADITIERVKLRSHASALKFGTASHHGFRRIHASDIEVVGAYRSVVAIQSVDGAVIEDVTVERVKARDVGNAFFLRLGHRTRSKEPGIIRNVVLRDMEIHVRPENPGEHMDVDAPHNQIPASIVGLADQPIENVRLENITIDFPGGGNRAHAEIPLDQLSKVPEFPHHYPEFSMWGELPAWGVYLRHARDITFRNVSFTLAQPDFRPAIVADQAPGLALVNVVVGNGGGEPIVALRASPGATIRAPPFPAGTREAVREL